MHLRLYDLDDKIFWCHAVGLCLVKSLLFYVSTAVFETFQGPVSHKMCIFCEYVLVSSDGSSPCGMGENGAALFI